MAKTKRMESYTFPKWRSSDALSASLVASRKTEDIIPADSSIPERRRKMMAETERLAEIDKEQLFPPKKANPLYCIHAAQLSPLIANGPYQSQLLQVNNHKPWCDPQTVRQSVFNESIANIWSTREFFESQAEANAPNGMTRSYYCSPPYLQ